MRYGLVSSVPLAVLLAGCEMMREDQTPDEVKAELAKAVLPQPGLWAMHFEVRSFEAAGVPAENVAKARKEIEARGRLGQLTCLTEASVAAARAGEVLGMNEMVCRVAYFKAEGEAYDGVWLCRAARDDATVEATGQSKADGDVSTLRVNSSIPGSQGLRFTMEVVATSKRKGDCPAG